MSVKKEVFDHLEKHTDTSLDELKDKLSEFNQSTVRRYFFEFKKGQTTGTKSTQATSGKKKTAGRTKSLRNRILSYLDEHPQSESGALYQVFPKANRKTVRNYLHQWRATKPKKKTLGKIEAIVFQYLDRHPHINLNDLKSKFPDSGKKLITIFRNWKQAQVKSAKVITKSEAETTGDSVSQQQLIKTLTSVVEKQKVTIEQQKRRIRELRAQLAKKPAASLSGITKKIKNTLLRPKR